MRWTLVAAFFAAYLSLDWVSYIYPLQNSAITPWNPHPALAIALLIVGGQRWLPVVAAVIFSAEVVIRHAPAGVPITIMVSTVLALGYAAIAAALANVLSPSGAIESPRQLGRVIVVIAVGTLLTGSLYVGSLWAAGANLPGPYFAALLQFWIGDCVGIIVTLPVLLLLRDSARRAEAIAALGDPVAWLQVGSVVFALWLVFGPAFAQPFKFFYALFLPLIWIAMRFGLLGSAIAALAIQCCVIAAVLITETSALSVFELQVLLIALTITGLFMGVSVDERGRVARELRESLRMAAAGEMSAALAHELNQPLAACGAYVKSAMLLAAASEREQSPALLETLRKAQGEALRAGDVVRRLRDFFRTGSTKLESASLPAITASVVSALEPSARQLGISLTQRFERDLPAVLVDPLQIEVVLRNLIANGVEAASGTQARSVQVEVARGAYGYVQTTVRDSGKGVSSDQASQIFETFWTTRPTGMGVGLAISRAIIEAHGGRIWVETPGPGVFSFTLPCVQS